MEMDHSVVTVTDFPFPLEEPKHRKYRPWKHRRSRSTSNLAIGVEGKIIKTDSDQESKEIDSDEAERSFAKLSLACRNSKSVKKSSLMQNVESDSFNELFSANGQRSKISQSKRRKRFIKRMNVESSSEIEGGVGGGGNGVGPSSSSSSSSKMLDPNQMKKSSRKKSFDQPSDGKRKRSQHLLENPSSSNDNKGASGGDIFNEPLGMAMMTTNNEDDEEMKSDEEDDSSSLSSDSGDENISVVDGHHGHCPHDADDEQSDWVGDDFELPTDKEKIMRHLRENACAHAPNREIRAGRRRIFSNRPPVFSYRTSANELLSKFLQDPGQNELKLHPMRKEEQIQLSHLASLYSLQMHYLNEEASGSTPVLIKTEQTSKMDIGNEEVLLNSPGAGGGILPFWESDSKRVKK